MDEPFNPSGGVGELVLGFLLYIVLGLVPILGVLYVIYFLVTLPMRRNERARGFLDLLELGLREGRTPEAAIRDAVASQDRSLGARFHLLAAHLEQGLRLSQALEQVSRLLPPQVCAMLRTGERIGDLGKVLPACRLLLRDSTSQVRGALNYLLLLVFVVTPFAVFMPLLIRVKILPSFKEIFEGMLEGAQLPELTRWVFATSDISTLLMVTGLSLLWLLTLFYLGGPRLRRWLELVLPVGLSAWDRLLLRLPWRRKRLQRDFSAMLALLLEAEVPESEAVRMAGEATDNAAFASRAEAAGRLLVEGRKLPDAVQALDDSGEFGWRLGNAISRGGGFVRALAGWHEALDAKAFQLEQTAAQLTTTFLVLLNGAIIACVVVGMFMALVKLLNMATLW